MRKRIVPILHFLHSITYVHISKTIFISLWINSFGGGDVHCTHLLVHTTQMTHLLLSITLLFLESVHWFQFIPHTFEYTTAVVQIFKMGQCVEIGIRFRVPSEYKNWSLAYGVYIYKICILRTIFVENGKNIEYFRLLFRSSLGIFGGFCVKRSNLI